MSSSRNSTSRNAGIDLLRGLSIVLVVLHHIGLRIPLKKTALAPFAPKDVWSALNYNGYEAVFIFFVVSGFLITTNALTRWGRLPEIDLRAFYARRAARILPCLILLVAVLSALHLVGARDYVIERAGQSLGGAIASALGLYLNWYEGHFGYLPGGWDVLWSLSIEEIFYLGFPLVCLVLRWRWLLVLALVGLALSLPMTHEALAGNEVWQEKAYLPGMAGIAAGILGALLVSHYTPKRAWVPRLFVIIGGAGVGADLCLALWPLLADGALLLLTTSTMMLVAGFAWQEKAGVLRPLRGTGWLRSFGRLSYEIYLTHMFVVFAVVRVFHATGGEHSSGFLFYPPAVALCWGLGALVARFVSQPSEGWLRARLALGSRQ